jgi:DNA-directed RNA polymerase specialized sigma24 family protein
MKVVAKPLAKAEAGWPQPLIDLYQLKGVSLVRLAYLLTGDANAAEDLVHDAFVSSFARWDHVREPGP